MADSPNRSSKLGWLIALMVILLGALVALNMYLLLSDDGDHEDSEKAVEQVEAPKPALYVELDPFTVNLQGDLCGQRLLYVGLSLQVADTDTESYLLKHMPQLRSRMLMLLSGQSSQTVSTQQGKEQLKAEILELFAPPRDDGQPELQVDDVLFTEFIVQ
ncbi:MAG TPA: flagellar basal body-associated protein FliL [Alcanivorax sp.]|nr:flagellar basal body-associated protein FliL [Alcanivorax sp.]